MALPNYYAPYLGSTFLTAFTKVPLLTVGKDKYSYQEVCDLGVIQPRACRILSRIAKELDVKSVRGLYEKTSPYTLAGTHGCGVTTLFVALRLFEAEGLSVPKWYADGKKDPVVTFTSLKHREQQAELRTNEDERKRRRLRSRRQVKESERATMVHDRSPRT